MTRGAAIDFGGRVRFVTEAHAVAGYPPTEASPPQQHLLFQTYDLVPSDIKSDT